MHRYSASQGQPDVVHSGDGAPMSAPTIAGRPVTPLWVFPAAVVVALAGGAVAAMAPLPAALALVVVLLVVGVALRPAFAAYVLLGVGPVIIGIDRGSVIPV